MRTAVPRSHSRPGPADSAYRSSDLSGDLFADLSGARTTRPITDNDQECGDQQPLDLGQ